MGGKGVPLHLVALCLEVTGCESSSGPGQRKKFQGGAQGLGIWGAVDQGRGRWDLHIRNLQGPLRPRLSCNQVQLLGLETPIPARNVWTPVLIPHLSPGSLIAPPPTMKEVDGSILFSAHLLCPVPFLGDLLPGEPRPSESRLAASTPFTAPLDVQKRLTPWEVSVHALVLPLNS